MTRTTLAAGVVVGGHRRSRVNSSPSVERVFEARRPRETRPLPLLQRFDDDSTAPLTPEELKARWVHFHHEIRRLSGTRLQRIAGRMLGEDTWRYKTARTIFRPPLRAWRKWRKKEKTRPTLVSAPPATEIYPVDERPRVTHY